MSIKYIIIPEQKRTIAVMSKTNFDAERKIAKMLGSDFYACRSYEMPNQFKASVKCSENDVYDENVGRMEAKKKVLAKYHKCFDKKIEQFKRDMEMVHKKVIEIA